LHCFGDRLGIPVIILVRLHERSYELRRNQPCLVSLGGQGGPEVMHATCSRVGHPPEVPVTGERKSVKILGAFELCDTRFHYRQDAVFNATTHFAFLEQLARRYRRQGAILIQNNASYHKDADAWKWFAANRRWLEVHQLPPYSPELNPTERPWQHTRKNGTHNRFFGGLDALLATLTRVFGEMQSHPQLIQANLTPFC
jgi:transposase